MKRPSQNIRFASKAQITRIKQAAREKGWSLNDFVIRSADEKAEEILSTKSARVPSSVPSLQAEGVL